MENPILLVQLIVKVQALRLRLWIWLQYIFISSLERVNTLTKCCHHPAQAPWSAILYNTSILILAISQELRLYRSQSAVIILTYSVSVYCCCTSNMICHTNTSILILAISHEQECQSLAKPIAFNYAIVTCLQMPCNSQNYTCGFVMLMERPIFTRIRVSLALIPHSLRVNNLPCLISSTGRPWWQSWYSSSCVPVTDSTSERRAVMWYAYYVRW